MKKCLVVRANVAGEVERLLREYRQNQELVRNIGAHYYQIIYPVQLRHHEKMGISTREIGAPKVRIPRSSVRHHHIHNIRGGGVVRLWTAPRHASPLPHLPPPPLPSPRPVTPIIHLSTRVSPLTLPVLFQFPQRGYDSGGSYQGTRGRSKVNTPATPSPI